MCGRYVLRSSIIKIANHFGVPTPAGFEFTPCYNIPPSFAVPTVHKEAAAPALSLMKWGLIPSWAKTPAIGNKLSNARAETVASKPSFRSAFKHRRCLIPATGFYEWKKITDRKQPFFIHLLNQEVFAFAGLWETWHDPQGDEVHTCAIITTEANAVMEPIHNRMPVILDPADYDRWLDTDTFDADSLQSLLVPFPADEMAAYPVSTDVNSPRNQGKTLIEPVPA